MKRKASNLGSRPTLKRQRTIIVNPQRDVQMVMKRERSIPALLTSEKKYNDTSSVADVTTTATIVSLNSVAAGDTALLRDGNKILCVSIQIRATLVLESLAANSIIRYLIVHDKNSNGTAPTAAQVFEGTPAVYSMKSVANASRFTTLLDKVVVLNNQSDTAGAVAKAYRSEYIKVPQQLQLSQFADGSAAVPVSGSLSLIIIGDIAAGAADVDAIFNIRLRFIG